MAVRTVAVSLLQQKNKTNNNVTIQQLFVLKLLLKLKLLTASLMA